MRIKRLLLIAACFWLRSCCCSIFYMPTIRLRPPRTPPAAPPAVSVATAHTGFIANQLTVAGVFQAFQEIDVHGKVSGYIRHIYVDIGDRVHQGQTLAVLEVPELQAEVAGAQAGITPDRAKHISSAEFSCPGTSYLRSRSCQLHAIETGIRPTARPGGGTRA